MAGSTVFASGYGPTNPDSFHNLLANPTVTVEVRTDKYNATATAVHGVVRSADHLTDKSEVRTSRRSLGTRPGDRVRF
jgi:hypothetical protein